MKDAIVPLSALDTQPREEEKTRICWVIYRANKTRTDVHQGPAIDWFYSTDQNPIPKAKRILKAHPDFMYGNFVLIDEENGQIVSFSHIPSRREFYR